MMNCAACMRVVAFERYLVKGETEERRERKAKRDRRRGGGHRLIIKGGDHINHNHILENYTPSMASIKEGGK